MMLTGEANSTECLNSNKISKSSVESCVVQVFRERKTLKRNIGECRGILYCLSYVKDLCFMSSSTLFSNLMPKVHSIMNKNGPFLL